MDRLQFKRQLYRALHAIDCGFIQYYIPSHLLKKWELIDNKATKVTEKGHKLWHRLNAELIAIERN